MLLSELYVVEYLKRYYALIPLVGFILQEFSSALELQLKCTYVWTEGGVRVCGDAVLLEFWCGFAEIFILSCGIAVIQNQAVYGIKKFSGNFNAVCCFLVLFCSVFLRISVRLWGIRTPLKPPSEPVLFFFFLNPAGIMFKTEPIRKLSNFNFYWTKTLYPSNLNKITYFLHFSRAIDISGYL